MNKTMNSRKLPIPQYWYDFEQALRFLSSAIERAEGKELDELEKMGLIQSFLVVQELAWEVLNDYLQSNGFNFEKESFYGKCLEFELIESPEQWRKIQRFGSSSAHHYDEKKAAEACKEIIEKFHPAVEHLKNRLSELYEQDNE